MEATRTTPSQMSAFEAGILKARFGDRVIAYRRNVRFEPPFSTLRLFYQLSRREARATHASKCAFGPR